VLWHVFGLHHPVRLEDFPVQPCISTGSSGGPTLLDGNPCIDLPAAVNEASCCANANAPASNRHPLRQSLAERTARSLHAETAALITSGIDFVGGALMGLAGSPALRRLCGGIALAAAGDGRA